MIDRYIYLSTRIDEGERVRRRREVVCLRFFRVMVNKCDGDLKFEKKYNGD